MDSTHYSDVSMMFKPSPITAMEYNRDITFLKLVISLYHHRKMHSPWLF